MTKNVWKRRTRKNRYDALKKKPKIERSIIKHTDIIPTEPLLSPLVVIEKSPKQELEEAFAPEYNKIINAVRPYTIVNALGRMIADFLIDRDLLLQHLNMNVFVDEMRNPKNMRMNRLLSHKTTDHRHYTMQLKAGIWTITDTNSKSVFFDIVSNDCMNKGVVLETADGVFTFFIRRDTHTSTDIVDIYRWSPSFDFLEMVPFPFTLFDKNSETDYSRHAIIPGVHLGTSQDNGVLECCVL